MDQIKTLLSRFQLEPHPEGGYFRETYRSLDEVDVPWFGTKDSRRNAGTASYYLLGAGERSKLHRIKSDEVWHFYGGDPLLITMVDAFGKLSTIRLGNPFSDAVCQAVVPKGVWFGAEPAPGGQYSFVGCTVAPGFDFQDFELADPKSFLEHWPHLENQVGQLL